MEQSKLPYYSIVIPCYNEQKNIPILVDRLLEVVQRPDVEVLFVNNGSTDGSAEILETQSARAPFTRVVTVENNQGYGFGILAGLKECRGQYLGWTHADIQADPQDVITAIELIEQATEKESLYLKGQRYGRPVFDQLFTVGMSFFETLYLKTLLWDINAQPNLFHRSFYKSWNNPPTDFSLDLYALYMAKKQKQTLIRFPVAFPERQHGQSSWNTSFSAKWKFIKRTLDFSTKLKNEL